MSKSSEDSTESSPLYERILDLEKKVLHWVRFGADMVDKYLGGSFEYLRDHHALIVKDLEAAGFKETNKKSHVKKIQEKLSSQPLDTIPEARKRDGSRRIIPPSPSQDEFRKRQEPQREYVVDQYRERRTYHEERVRQSDSPSQRHFEHHYIERERTPTHSIINNKRQASVTSPYPQRPASRQPEDPSSLLSYSLSTSQDQNNYSPSNNRPQHSPMERTPSRHEISPMRTPPSNQRPSSRDPPLLSPDDPRVHHQKDRPHYRPYKFVEEVDLSRSDDEKGENDREKKSVPHESYRKKNNRDRRDGSDGGSSQSPDRSPAPSTSHYHNAASRPRVASPQPRHTPQPPTHCDSSPASPEEGSSSPQMSRSSSEHRRDRKKRKKDGKKKRKSRQTRSGDESEDSRGGHHRRDRHRDKSSDGSSVEVQIKSNKSRKSRSPRPSKSSKKSKSRKSTSTVTTSFGKEGLVISNKKTPTHTRADSKDDNWPFGAAGPFGHIPDKPEKDCPRLHRESSKGKKNKWTDHNHNH